MEQSKSEYVVAPTPIEVSGAPEPVETDEIDVEVLKQNILNRFKAASRDTKLAIKHTLQEHGHESLGEDIAVEVLQKINGMLD